MGVTSGAETPYSFVAHVFTIGIFIGFVLLNR